jgi:GGDEF domain-containing protein
MAQLGRADFLARMGGEKFGCLVAEMTSQDASAVAERVRSAFETTPLPVTAEAITAT